MENSIASGSKLSSTTSSIDEILNQLKFPDDDKVYTVNSGDFQEHEFIGKGKSPVHRATFIPKNILIAQKHLFYKSSRSTTNSEEEKALRKLKNEFEIMREVSHHPCIVQFYGYYQLDVKLIICMELMKCSLRDVYLWIHRNSTQFKKVPEMLLGGVTMCLIEALAFCKEKYIIHRDIKPSNILLNDRGEIKLCDFGESRFLEQSQASTSVGTFVYWPPERFEQYRYDVRNDVWGIGMTLAETAYGGLPHVNESNFESDAETFWRLKEIITSIKPEELVEKSCGDKYSNKAKDFLRLCLNPLETRPKFDGLQQTEFYQWTKGSEYEAFVSLVVIQVDSGLPEVKTNRSLTTSTPPATWKEHWGDHSETLNLTYSNEHVAIYYDNAMDPEIAWPQQYLTDIWSYIKSVYGSFGTDPHLYVIFHAIPNGKHVSTYFEANHEYKNVLDMGIDDNQNQWRISNYVYIGYALSHLVERCCQRVFGSPAMNIWSKENDWKFMEIFYYDFLKNTDRFSEAANLMEAIYDQEADFPRPRTQWFKNWFLPIYEMNSGNESKTLSRFFELLAEYFPKQEYTKFSKQGNAKYARDMNMGEFVHFWSGAVGRDLTELAKNAFGWDEEWESQLNQAKEDFSGIPYEYNSNKLITLKF